MSNQATAANAKQSLSCLGVAGYIFLGSLAIWAIGNISKDNGAAAFGLLIVAAFVAPPIIRHIRMRKYFGSEEFLTQKAALVDVVREHNEIADYVEEVRDRGLFELGSSSTGAQSHLATYENTSRHNYKRDRHEANLAAPNVHNCSLQVVRNASREPIKYLMKYFDLSPTEANLQRVETLGESIASLDGAIANLEEREAAIAQSIDPPAFILKH